MRRRDPFYQKDYALRCAYNMTLEEWNAMVKKQKGKCAICKEKPVRKSMTGPGLCVDHNHKTGKVRGLLCTRCNSFNLPYVESGMYKAALKYLRDYDG